MKAQTLKLTFFPSLSLSICNHRMYPPKITYRRGTGEDSGDTEHSKGVLAEISQQNGKLTCCPSSPFGPAVPGMPIPAVPYKVRKQELGWRGIIYSTCTDLSTHELGGERNGGKSLCISTLFSVYIDITLSQLFLAPSWDDGSHKQLVKSNDLFSLFSLWSRQSRNTIQPYRAWQARFPLERKTYYQVFLLPNCLSPIILKRSLQKHKQRNIFPDVPVLPAALQLRIYRGDYVYPRCPLSPPSQE